MDIALGKIAIADRGYFLAITASFLMINHHPQRSKNHGTSLNVEQEEEMMIYVN